MFGKKKHGFMKGCFAYPIQNCFDHEAKVIAWIHAMELSWYRSWTKLWLESNSMYVANLFQQ